MMGSTHTYDLAAATGGANVPQPRGESGVELALDPSAGAEKVLACLVS